MDDLAKYWLKKLYIKDFVLGKEEYYDDAFEFLVSLEKQVKNVASKNISHEPLDLYQISKSKLEEDKSFTNGSSISFALEYKNLSLLFLADSHPKVIAESIRMQYIEAQFPIKFDLIKISHHGCQLNTSDELLELIDSEIYIFSTDGSSFNHPDIEVIAKVVCRPAQFKRKLFFNYPVPIALTLDDSDLKLKYNYEINIAYNNLPTEIIL